MLMLLPLIGRWDAAWALAASGVPLEIAVRVLASSAARRRYLAPSASFED